MYDFFDRATHLFATGGLGRFGKDYETVSRFRSRLQGVYSKAHVELDNLEWVFNAIEMAGFLDTETVKDGVPAADARSSLIRLIGAVLERTQLYQLGAANAGRTILHGPGAYNRLVDFALGIAETRRYDTITFVTFNYDIGLDMALHARSVSPNYAIVDEFDSKRHALRWPVYKLHGSLHWYRGREGELTATGLDKISSQALAAQPRDNSMFIHLSDVFMHHSRIGRSLDDAFIIPPAEAKTDARKLVEPVWRAAAKALAEAEVIAIIGYSLPSTDQFFRLFFGLATLSETLLQRVWVINKSAAARATFESLLSGHARQRMLFQETDIMAGIVRMRDFSQDNNGSL